MDRLTLGTGTRHDMPRMVFRMPEVAVPQLPSEPSSPSNGGIGLLGRGFEPSGLQRGPQAVDSPA